MPPASLAPLALLVLSVQQGQQVQLAWPVLQAPTALLGPLGLKGCRGSKGSKVLQDPPTPQCTSTPGQKRAVLLRASTALRATSPSPPGLSLM